MGSKPTKIEGTYLPSTPVTLCASSSLVNINVNYLDPRSPAESRTPISQQNKRIDASVQLDSVDVPERDLNNKKTLDILRKRFLKSFTYNLNDPRSPSFNFNRTPLVLEDTLEKSLCLDDTFADLFVESHLPDSVNKLEKLKENIENESEQEIDTEMAEQKVIIDLEEPPTSPKTPISIQQAFDPRSPSIGVERTPIIFTDDEVDDKNEDIMLESILATLSLNLNTSGNSSMLSMTPQSANVNFNDRINLQVLSKPMNKHLDRVRAGNKSTSKAKNRMSKRRQSQQQIYEDQENYMSMTPKLKISEADKNYLAKGKRTPLSCVRNRNGTHSRSRSVESCAKSIKTRLTLTSFDDSLNFTENSKVPNLWLDRQGSQESLGQ